MKYQGFYDYALDSSGNPDRQYTSSQFCKHLSMIFGSGIVITNKTGNDAWKVEKIESDNLKIRVKLGNNSFNFASLDGNPFAIDEEINIELSQGSDRWDAIILRADATSNVRATDIKVLERQIELTRNETIYDLRLARIHIVNNTITEIIDDRFNNDYCGIAAGLATINAEEILNKIQAELEGIESGELVALKNGMLQTGLNSEKLGGSTKTEIMNAIHVTGGFSVNKGETIEINLGFKPKAVFVSTGNRYYGGSIYEGTELVTTEKPTYTVWDSTNKLYTTLQLTENGFSFYRYTSSGDSMIYGKGTGYRYIAFA